MLSLEILTKAASHGAHAFGVIDPGSHPLCDTNVSLIKTLNP